MKVIKYSILIIFFALSLLGGNILIHFNPSTIFTTFGTDLLGLANTLVSDGHSVSLDTTSIFPPLDGYDVLYSFLGDSLSQPDISRAQRFIGNGGRAIFMGECWPSVGRNVNALLADPEWDDSLGIIRNNLDRIRDWPFDTIHPPWDTLGIIHPTIRLPNFDRSSGYFYAVDTLRACDASSFSILSSDSGTAIPLIWGDTNSTSTLGAYDSFAVLAVKAFYGSGEIIVSGEMFNWSQSSSTYDTTIYGLDYADNRQFMRNLFATNDRADSAAIEQEDSTFRVHLHGDFTDFNPDSCEWRFQILHVWPPYEFRGHEIGARFIAPDILEIDNPPIYNPVYDTVEVCLMFLPDYDDETVLWDFPVCDTFKFDFSNIAETPTPQSFAISAHPNPFNSAVTITAPAGAEIEVFDVNGRRIAKLIPPSPPLTRGGHGKSPLSKGDLGGLFIWRPDPSLGSGVYLVRATAGDVSTTKRIVFLK